MLTAIMMGNPGSAGYALGPDVVLVPVEDGSARLLDMDGDFFVLSVIGTEMLRLTLSHGPDAAAARIAARYRASPDQVRMDLTVLLDELRRRGLIEQGGAPSLRRRLRRVLAMASTALPLRLFARFAPRQGLGLSLLILFARLCLALFGWGSTVHAWSSMRPQVSIPRSGKPQEWISATDRAIREAAARIPLVACKERALCCWFLLNSRGIPATLVVGIQLYPLSGHCWCQVGDQILTDVPERCGLFDPVVRYGPAAAASAERRKECPADATANGES